MATKTERDTTSLGAENLALVGRDGELERLDAALERSVEYLSPQLVVLEGDRGVGKTRLTRGWVESLLRRPKEVRVYDVRAEPGDGDRELLGRLLRKRFNLEEKADPDEARTALREQCQEVFEDRRMTEILHFLGSFMNLQFQGNPFLRLLKEDPLEHEQIAATVLRRFLETDSKSSPIVLVFDDLQHADDPSLDILRELGEALEGARIVILAVTRPKLRLRRPDWGFREGDVTEMQLGPLDPAAASRYLEELLSRAAPLPSRFVEESVEMTGGNPLFMQQLALMLMDQGVLDTRREKWAVDMDRFTALELPMSVEDAIDARLLALSVEERQVLEMAATMGNVFWLGALVVMGRIQAQEANQSVWGTDEVAQRIKTIVDGLVERDYIMPMPDSWIPGEEEFLFKHNMEFSIIESAVDPARKRRNHRMVAQWIESRLPRLSADQFEFLAQQYEEGEAPRRAAFCFIRAGDLARERFANEQAIRDYEAGLKLLDETDMLTRLDALHSVGAVYALVGRQKEAKAHFMEMLRLAWILDMVSKGGAALGRIGRVHRELGEYDEAMERYLAAQHLFRRSGDRRGLASTMDDIGKVHYLKGDYAEALNLYRKALELRKEIGDERSIALTLANMGQVFEDAGHFQEALRSYEESLSLRRRIEDRIGTVDSLLAVGGVFQELGEAERAAAFWTEGLDIARGTGDRLQQARLLVRLANLHTRTGDMDRVHEQLLEAGDIATGLGDDRLRSDVARIQGRVKVAGGALDEGRDLLHTALRIAEERGHRSRVGAAERALAEVAASRGFAHEAEERFERAMAIFSEMGNHLEVARCCDAMADYYVSTGGSEKAERLIQSAREIRKKLLDAAGR